MGVLTQALWQSLLPRKQFLQIVLCGGLFFVTAVCAYVDVSQAERLGSSKTWHWSTYHRFVDCIDQQLMQYEARKRASGSSEPFRVWGPTPPDVTIELSLRHPEWELTRTNDFMQPDRIQLAIQHGWDVDAVVVTESINWDERTVSAKQSEVPEISSLWLNWKDYFLIRLYKDPSWKPNRFVCQRGRWQAFIFTN